MSKYKTLVKPALGMSLISGLSLIFSFMKESVFAYYFGTTADADAYVIAIQLPVILFSVVSTAISNVLIPIYAKSLIQRGVSDAQKYVSNLITVVSFLTLILLVVFEIFAPWIIKVTAPGLVKETNDLTCLLFRMIMPTVLLTQLININTGILNVHRKFILPVLGTILLNSTYVFCVVALAHRKGIYAAVIGVIIGTLVQFLYSIFLRSRSVKYIFKFDLKEKSMVDSIKMALPVFIGIGADEINKVIDKVISSFLQEGSIASLNYASKLSSAVSTLLLSSIASVAFPEYSRCVSECRFKDLAEYFVLSLKLYILIMFPLIIGGTFLSSEIIMIVFKRGLFDEASVDRTAPIFACYLASLFFVAIRISSSRFFYSYGDSKTPMKNSIIGIGINIILNIILAHYLQALGLALATTISAAIIGGLILKDAKRQNTFIKYRNVLPLTIKVLLSSIAMVLGLCLFKFMVGYKMLMTGEFLNQLIYLFISLLIGFASYCLMLIVTKTDEVQIVLQKVLKRKKV